MENNGITGLNPTKAMETIENFKDLWNEARSEVQNGYNSFARELMTKWYSPRAVDFGEKATKTMSALSNENYIAEGTILKNTVASYNMLARSNGLDLLDTEEYDWYLTLGEYDSWWNKEYGIEFKETGPNGEVGMNIMLAKVAVSLFKEKIASAISKFDELPTDIAFYDPDGNLAAAFKELITVHKNNVQEKLTEMATEVEKAFEEEENIITIAKNQATDTLSA